MNRNIKMYPMYLSITWDILFIWTISTMFYTQVKGLTYSQAVSLESILTLCSCLFCMVVMKFMKKVTPINSVKIASVSAMFYLLINIFGEGYLVLASSQIFLGFTYSLGIIKSNLVITQSLSVVKRDKEYQRVYGKGLSGFYILEAICAVLSTYIFDYNPYLVYWLALGIVVISFIYALFFTEPKKYQDNNVKIRQTSKSQPKYNVVNKKKMTQFLIALIVFAFMVRAVLGIASSTFRIYLQEVISMGHLPLWSFGYIYAAMRLFIAISTKYQFKYDLKYGVKCIVVFAGIGILTYLFNGLIFSYMPMYWLTILLVIILTYVQNSLRPPLNIFINNYIRTCVPQGKEETIYGLRAMMEYLGHSVSALIFSQLIGISNNYGMANLWFIAIVAVPFVISTIVFIRLLIKTYASKNTIIKKEYVEDID